MAETEADAALAIQSDALEAIAIKASIDLLADKESPWVAKIGNRGKGYETIAHFYVINRRYEEGIQYLPKSDRRHSGSLERAFATGHQPDAPRARGRSAQGTANWRTTTIIAMPPPRTR